MRIFRWLVVLVIIVVAGFFAAWLFFSPMMTHYIIPKFARGAGFEVTSAKGEWSVAKGGKLDGVKFKGVRWEGQISTVRISWKWIGRAPLIDSLEIFGLRMSEVPLSERPVAEAEAFNLLQKDSTADAVGLLGFFDKKLHVSLNDATVHFGKIFPDRSEEVFLSVAAAEYVGGNFSASGKAAARRDGSELGVFDWKFEGVLEDVQTLQWAGNLRCESILSGGKWELGQGVILFGPAAGLGLDFATWDASAAKGDVSYGTFRMGMTFEAVTQTGVFECKWQGRMASLLPQAVRDVVESRLVGGDESDVYGKLSWSPDGWEGAVRMSVGERVSAAWEGLRRPNETWQVSRAELEAEFVDGGKLHAFWEVPASDFVDRDEKTGGWIVNFSLKEIPEEVLALTSAYGVGLEMQSGISGNMRIMVNIGFWDWDLALSGGHIAAKRNGLIWRGKDWKVSASGGRNAKFFIPDNLQVTANDGFLLDWQSPKQNGFQINFENISLLTLQCDEENVGGIILRKGKISNTTDGEVSLDVIGSDIPGDGGWIAPGADRKVEDWHVKVGLQMEAGRFVINESSIICPASCMDCELNVSGWCENPSSFEIKITGLGVDFSHMANLSEIGLAALGGVFLSKQPSQGDGDAAMSTGSSLVIDVLDCVVPRLGRGDLKGRVSLKNNIILLEDAAINLDIGGVVCQATWHFLEGEWRIKKISGALKTLDLPRLRNIIPKEYAQYLTGQFTMTGEFSQSADGVLKGNGHAEWTNAEISSVPAMRSILMEAGEKISPDFARMRLESGQGDFRLEMGQIISDELMIYGDKGILETSGKYNMQTDELDSGIVLHLDTRTLRKARLKVGGITVSGQTLVTFGRQQDELTTIPGLLPVRGKLNGKLFADWDAWLQSIGIPAGMSGR